MLSHETEEKLAKILLALSEGERSVDISRQVLQDNFDYDPFQIFNFLDNGNKNKIDVYDIIQFLHSKCIFTNELEVNLLILQYDINGDNTLSFPEFLNLIQCDNSIKTNNPYSQNKKKLSYNVEYSLSKLLEREIELSKNLLNLFYDIKRRYDFNIHQLFHSVKGLSNVITFDSIKIFLNKTNGNYLDPEINYIMKRLDINKDGKIDLCEFHTLLGYPECKRCCPINQCSNCGCLTCDYCSTDMYCPVHNCIHNSFSNVSSNKNNIRKYNNDIGERTEKVLNESDLINGQNSNYMKTRNKNFNNNLNNITYNNNISNSSYSNDNNNIRQQSFKNDNLIYTPPRESFQQFRNIDSPLKIISENLSLRLSPERKFPPLKSNYYNSCEKSPVKLENNNNCIDNIFNKSNLNGYEECQFNDYLKELMLAESKIENEKINLASKLDFNPEDTFRIFENEGAGILTKEDIRNGFNLLNIYATDSDIKLLMKRFDLKKQGYLNFADFFDMIVPFDKDFRNLVENRIPNSCCNCRCPDVFSLNTRNSLKNLFEMIIDYENKFNCMKKGYNTLRLKLKDIFHLIDNFNSGSFNNDDLNIYLKKNCLFRNSKETDLLYIRLDKNRDGKIEYSEIEDELLPLL